MVSVQPLRPAWVGAPLLFSRARKLKVDKLSADIKADESKVRVEVGFFDAWID